MKYLAGEAVEVNQKALDVNGDKAENVKDVVRLARHLAGEPLDVYIAGVCIPYSVYISHQEQELLDFVIGQQEADPDITDRVKL